MFFTHLKLKNWRNFKSVDIPMREHTYLIGPNASGKSNLLDVFRFLRDVSKANGGGLQKALHDRGGISKLRCLHARKNPEVHVEVELKNTTEDEFPTWRYVLAFKSEPSGKHRTLITSEEVWRGGEKILSRPDETDKKDSERLTQTALEQIQANAGFRDLAGYFSDTVYLHLVPQLLKFGEQIGGNRLEDDPFGQGFLERIRKTPQGFRDTRLKRIEAALQRAVPQFRELHFKVDDQTGASHLEATYVHFRPNAGRQREEQFSDGTLRLIALLWVLQESDSLLLLEEPELSLNNGIVAQIPRMFHRIQRDRKKRARQILVSTHSEALLSNTGIDPNSVLILELASEGTVIRTVTEEEGRLLEDGFTAAEVLLRGTNPPDIEKIVQ